jgi:prevent-host-death family protein
MKRVVSATEARVHFGELLRQVVQSREAVIVERDGKPQVVILDLEQYEQLKAAQPQGDWQLTMEKALDLASRIRSSRGGQPLPEPAEVIRQVREERNEQLGLP